MAVANQSARVQGESETARRLRISEIFHSLQGESDSVGWPTVFRSPDRMPAALQAGAIPRMRFMAGSGWASTKSWRKSQPSARRHVCVTGGEPLAQKRCLDLLESLCERGHEGVAGDFGCPGHFQGRCTRATGCRFQAAGFGVRAKWRNLWSNVQHLRARDQVKFVIGDRADYDWSVERMREHELAGRCVVLFSPVQGQLEPAALAEWILADRLPVRFQLQLHKILWGNQPGR